jgi:2-polyprenyl-3-methyl-5-hydroxy-6-metoxy-1,4-benzoquinol methylase
MRDERACPACGQEAITMLTSVPMAHLDELDLGYVVVTCDRCGTGFASETASPASYRRYYASYSKYDVARTHADIPPLVREIADGAADFVRPFLSTSSRICDVGAAIGVFLDALRTRGVGDVVGYDPAPEAPALAEGLFGVEVRPGFLHEGFDASAYDLVSLVAVLEHLLDPHGALLPMVSSMESGAKLFVEIPAADRFHEASGEWLGEFSIEHVNFFGTHGLAVFGARCGLTRIAEQRVVYGNGQRGLRMLFEKRAGHLDPHDADAAESTRRSLRAYVQDGERLAVRIDAKLERLVGRPTILYGAGAHSARLLCRPVAHGVDFSCAVDRNPNLYGHTLGGIPIVSPDLLHRHQDAAILISSFHARRAIARDVAGQQPSLLVDLYEDHQ